MKKSTFFVSLRLTPVAALLFQGRSHAAEEALSDKAQWLKENLAILDNEQVSSPSKPSRHRLTALKPHMDIRPLSIDGEPLRPFVPDRKLPSQRELDEAALVAQRAKTAPQLS